MPTFFGRRYMRGGPGRIERWLGVGLLLLVGLIVCTFLLTTGYLGDRVADSGLGRSVRSTLSISDQPLFHVDPQDMPAPPPPHEHGVASKLLPAELDGLRRVALGLVDLTVPGDAVIPVQAVGPDQVTATTQPAAGWAVPPAELLTAARDFQVRWVYVGWYKEQDGGKMEPVGAVEFEAVVCVVDGEEPPNAFGLWRSRQPAEVEPIKLGRGGWIAGSAGRCGFWAGRYYSEVSMPRASADVLKGQAQRIAAGQLNYGGPFWAEAVLPGDGQVPGSLRYVRTAPLGLSELADCWLAEYAGGGTVGVMRPAGAKREAMLAGLRDRWAKADEKPSEAYGTEEPAEGGSGESAYGSDEHAEESSAEAGHTPAGPVGGTTVDLPAEAVGGPVAAGWAVVFPAAEYVFVVVNDSTGSAAASAKSLHDRVAESAGVSVAARPAESSASAARWFPDPGITGVLPPTRIERYTDNLYEKIDGRESQYRAYNFVELQFAQYTDTRHQHTFDVYIYDMGEPANALGIYMTERSGVEEVLELGRDGYRSGTSVYFYKGPYYVNVLAPAEGGATATQTALQIGRSIAGVLADGGEPFWVEALLPSEGRVPHALTYRAMSALGHDFLQRMFVARYELDGRKLQMVLLRAESAVEAGRLFGLLAEATARYDTVLVREEGEAGGRLVSESLGVFAVMFQQGVYLGGVVECEDRALAERQAELLRQRVAGQ